MVSFQCDGCSDVVKKPKLDMHRLRCNATFTCIDCSTTFQGPAQYKDHTSCISEAEKYQKSLYKGPKNGQNSAGPRGKQLGPANGKYTHTQPRQYPPRPQYGRPYSATGANVTPLGTPVRMSPVDSEDSSGLAPVYLKAATSSAKAADSEQALRAQAMGKRKVEDNGEGTGEPKKKKTKKDKKAKGAGKEVADSVTPLELGKEVAEERESRIQKDGDRKEKKKSKNVEKAKAGDESEEVTVAEQDEPPSTSGQPKQSPLDATGSSESKKKRSKKDKAAKESSGKDDSGADTAEAVANTMQEPTEDKKRKKKDRSAKVSRDAMAVTEGEDEAVKVAGENTQIGERKTRKRKRKSDSTHVEASVVSDSSKNSKERTEAIRAEYGMSSDVGENGAVVRKDKKKSKRRTEKSRPT